MPEQKKNLSRRDAIKLLGAAAGATVLANLPAKWSKPSLASGVLPAHAQTSCGTLFIEVLSGEFFWNVYPLDAQPDEISGGLPSGPGSTISWDCQEGCVRMIFDLIGLPTGSVRFTTIAGQFVENYDSNGPDGNLRDIVVDLASGAITIGAAGSIPSAGACSWPQVQPTIKDGENRRW